MSDTYNANALSKQGNLGVFAGPKGVHLMHVAQTIWVGEGIVASFIKTLEAKVS